MKVIRDPVLVDTGPLVAMLHQRDRYHKLCSVQAKELVGPVYTCWPVITEAAWLLRGLSDGLERLLDLVALGDLTLLELEQTSATWMSENAKTYAELRPQLADVSLVYLAHREGVRHIFTLDRRDFLLYRDRDGRPFILLPENV